MLRLFRECDIFRKLPPEHREAPPEAALVSVCRVVAALLILVLASGEVSSLAPARRQRFDVDMRSSVDAAAPRKIRVLLNVTVHDFPCIDLSLDYQDVMGTRAVDVKTTVFKQRLHKDGTLVGDLVQNNPKTAVQGGPSNPSISKNYTGNETCGTCYGALPEGECCNTCSDVLYAYRLKRWALPRIESISQCKNDGTGKPGYQPPQIIRLDDYSSDDFLPKFSKLGTLSSTEARITTPFKLNLTWELSKVEHRSAHSDSFPELHRGAGKGHAVELWGASLMDDLFGEADAGSDLLAKASTRTTWPECVHRNVIVHGYDLGEALMVDLSKHGAKAGCWNDDCTETDKFDCGSMERCAEVCHEVAACQWWTFGSEDGVTKCWIRTGRHGREKRYGFSSGPRGCSLAANATAAGEIAVANITEEHATQPNATSTKTPDMLTGTARHVSHLNSTEAVASVQAGDGGNGEAPAVVPGHPPRRLMSFEDDYDSFGSRPHALNFGPSLHMPVFGMDTRENQLRKEQRGESCRIQGYFDSNKVPGNFHIGAHGAATPSYLSYFDDPAPPSQNMQHTINNLAFVEVDNGVVLNRTQPLDGFESPKAFTFQYYLTITPATVQSPQGGGTDGYQFRAGSFVTNELIGPAVFFRMDIDPIRVTYYTEEVRWTKLLVNLCAVVGGCIALCSMLGQLVETLAACAKGED